LKLHEDPAVRTVAILTLALTVLASSARGGETGKLSGVIRDRDTREPLVGANVVLLGTMLGASTSTEGFYFVNNVPPGLYRVQVRLIGYQTVVYNNVKVMADVTTELNAALPASAVELGAVEIIAHRPVVQKDLTSTRTIVDGETIVKDLRFQDVQEILELQAGVTVGLDGALHIRGGRSGGTIYQIDGIPVQNPFLRSTAGEVEVETVQELQAQLGTFDAEYGNAADGVINIYTKDGTERYTGRLTYESPRLNRSPYWEKDWNLKRPEVEALPAEQQALYRDQVRKPDGTSAYDWVSVLDDPYTQDLMLFKALGTWSASLSGPVPFLGPLTFFATGRVRQENGSLPYGYTLFRSGSFKLTYPLSSKLSLRGTGDISNAYRQTYDHAYKYWRWWDSGLDTHGREGSYPIIHDRNDREMFQLRHVLSTSTFYEISLARIYDYSSQVVPDRTVVYNPTTGELISSDYVRRQWVDGNDSGFRYGDVRYWLNTKSTQYTAKGNIESQVHQSHQVRAGFETRWHEICRHRIGMPTLPTLEFFTYRPLEFGAYVQDKLEYSFMILKAGVRVDYFNPRAS
jgi:hypothetical protein